MENVPQQLINIAKQLIIYYFQNEHSNYPNIDKETSRIQSICDNAPLKIEPKKDRQQLIAYWDNGITYFTDYSKNLSNIYSILNELPTFVHELLHGISNELESVNFIEEGMIAYLTSKIIRYAINNPIKIDGISPDKFQMALENMDLFDGYRKPTEFISNVNIIMNLNGINSECEYLFNRNGLQVLTDHAKKISPEFAKILQNQKNKDALTSPNFQDELFFFFSNFNNFDFNQLSDTDIQMNEFLIQVLTTHPHKENYKQVFERAKQLSRKEIKDFLINLEITNLPLDDKLKRIKEILPQDAFKYKLHNSQSEIIEQFEEIINLYAVLPSSSFRKKDALAILIAYDVIHKKGQQKDLSALSLQCYSIVSTDFSEYMDLYRKSFFYIETIKKNKDKNIIDIINDNICNHIEFASQLPSPNSYTPSSYWSNISKIGKLSLRYSNLQKSDTYDLLFNIAFQSAICTFENRQYFLKDYLSFKYKMENLFTECKFPEAMLYCGLTPDLIYLHALSEKTSLQSPFFTSQMISILELLKNKNFKLGDSQGFNHKGEKLNTLSLKINQAYHKLVAQNNEKNLQLFVSLFDDLYMKTNILKDITSTLQRPFGKTISIKNKYITEVANNISQKNHHPKVSRRPLDNSDYEEK